MSYGKVLTYFVFVLSIFLGAGDSEKSEKGYVDIVSK